MDLKLARMKKGLNQKELADLLGVHPALISQYEHNKRRPGIKTAKKLANILDVSWTEFYEDDNENNRLEQEKCTVP